MAIKLVSYSLTSEEVREVENEAGGMFCITSKIFEIEVDGEIVKSEIVEN